MDIDDDDDVMVFSTDYKITEAEVESSMILADNYNMVCDEVRYRNQNTNLSLDECSDHLTTAEILSSVLSLSYLLFCLSVLLIINVCIPQMKVKINNRCMIKL